MPYHCHIPFAEFLVRFWVGVVYMASLFGRTWIYGSVGKGRGEGPGERVVKYGCFCDIAIYLPIY